MRWLVAVATVSDCDLSSYPAMSAAEVSSRPVPQYIAFVPALDDWGHAIDYYLDPGPDFGMRVMRSASSVATATPRASSTRRVPSRRGASTGTRYGRTAPSCAGRTT